MASRAVVAGKKASTATSLFSFFLSEIAAKDAKKKYL
jgi:hypothetical protein